MSRSNLPLFRREPHDDCNRTEESKVDATRCRPRRVRRRRSGVAHSLRLWVELASRSRSSAFGLVIYRQASHATARVADHSETFCATSFSFPCNLQDPPRRLHGKSPYSMPKQDSSARLCQRTHRQIMGQTDVPVGKFHRRWVWLSLQSMGIHVCIPKRGQRFFYSPQSPSSLDPVEM